MVLLSIILGATLLTSSLPFTVQASPAKISGSDAGPDVTSTSSSPDSSSSCGSGAGSGSGNGPFTDARLTFFDVGLGACGKTNKSSDSIVALNSQQYGDGSQGPGPNCFKEITITYNGKTHDATIMDECPSCPFGGLDLSRGLFDYFAKEEVGVLYGEWSFKDSGNSTSPGPGSGSDDGFGTGNGDGSDDGSGDSTSSGSGSPSSTMSSDFISPTDTSLISSHSKFGHFKSHTT